ncbi:acyltransferase family protein [Nocardioides speluncae]|uniref:acyltransferase family protein n=1 Tax=Nocardioides speluncae TaxID=2670337 RepID=UPI000D68ECF9|nr:acyltransferase [Nocardioides speluncae]
MTATEPTTASRRIDVYDGLRGIAVVLVVLSHGWTVWPSTEIDERDWLHPWFVSGNYAVSIFFAVGAFLATRSLIKRHEERGTVRFGVEFLRRFLRISAQVWLLLIAVAVVTGLESEITYRGKETGTSLFRIATYTWNWYLQDHAVVARPDLGHLWYLSVDMQVFVLILLAVCILRRWPVALLITLAALLAACLAWRAHVYETEGIYQALLRTTVRADAPLAGAVGAAAMPFLSKLAPAGKWLAGLAAIALAPLVYLIADPVGAAEPGRNFFGVPGVALTLALMTFMVGFTLRPDNRPVGVVLGSPPLAFLGRHSLALFLWHYPIFWYVSRHSDGWSWQERTLVGLAATAVIAFAGELIAERPMQRYLSSPDWREVESAGLAPYLAKRLRGGSGRREPAVPLGKHNDDRSRTNSGGGSGDRSGDDD